eukprot:SAG22_NODE_4515_length_1246_cov_2.011334_1_plen_205_part_10
MLAVAEARPNTAAAVAQWAEAEMATKERKAEGWLVVGGDADAWYNLPGEQVQSSGAAHVVIRPGMVAIAGNAFEGCEGLVSVLIPLSVTRITCGNVFAGAFRDCSSLASVAIPGSVTQIGDYAFYGCSSLASVAIPASVTQIGYCLQLQATNTLVPTVHTHYILNAYSYTPTSFYIYNKIYIVISLDSCFLLFIVLILVFYCLYC